MGRVCGRSIQSLCFKWPFTQMCQFPYSQGLSQPGITGIYNPLPAELLGNVSIFCNMHNCQLPNPERAHVLSTCSLQLREHTWKLTASTQKVLPRQLCFKTSAISLKLFSWSVLGSLAFTSSAVIHSFLAAFSFLYPIPAIILEF